MEIELVPLSDSNRPLLEALGQLYQYDFSVFAGWDAAPDGRYTEVDWDGFYREESRAAFLIHVGGEIGGFAMVYEGEAFRDPEERVWWMDQFFVMRKYRRCGVGPRAARTVFERHPGSWEVAEMSSNTAAQLFWRKVIREYTGGAFEEFDMDDLRWVGPVQYFATPREAGGS